MFISRRETYKYIFRVGLLGLITSLTLVACGGNGGSTTTSMGSMSSMDEGQGEFDFGEPADAAQADRTVDIAATNDLEFLPATISVSAGETITFRVTNTGSLSHDFFLGKTDAQDAHEVEMTEMRESGQMMEHHDPNAMSVAAGETKELTWHFTETGTVLYGCHQKGHYSAGMVGSVDIG